MTKEEENIILDQIRLSLKEYAFGDITSFRSRFIHPAIFKKSVPYRCQPPSL